VGVGVIMHGTLSGLDVVTSMTFYHFLKIILRMACPFVAFN